MLFHTNTGKRLAVSIKNSNVSPPWLIKCIISIIVKYQLIIFFLHRKIFFWQSRSLKAGWNCQTGHWRKDKFTGLPIASAEILIPFVLLIIIVIRHMIAKCFCIKLQTFFHGHTVVCCKSLAETKLLLEWFVFTTDCSKEMF